MRTELVTRMSKGLDEAAHSAESTDYLWIIGALRSTTRRWLDPHLDQSRRCEGSGPSSNRPEADMQRSGCSFILCSSRN